MTGIQRDRPPRTRSGCCAATSSAVKPPALPPISATRPGVAPAFLHGVADARPRRRRRRARPSARRAPARTRGRSRSSRGSSGCSTAQPRCTNALHPRRSSRRAPGRSGRRARARRSGARRVARRRAATAGRARSRSPDFHVTGRGSTSAGALEPADRAARDRAPRRAVRREHDDLRRRHRARAHAHDAARRPSRGRGASPSTARAPTRVPGAPITSRPKPSSLRHHASCVAVGRPRERALARAPRRLGVLVVLGEHRQRVPPSDPTSTRRPAVASETNASRAPSGENRGWPHADRVAAGDDLRGAPSAVARRTMRDASHGMSGRSHSCHASARAVGRPRRVPRVVGVRDAAAGHARAVERHDRDVARVVALERERDLAARRDRGRERAGRRGSAPARRRRRRATDDEPAVGRARRPARRRRPST